MTGFSEKTHPDSIGEEFVQIAARSILDSQIEASNGHSIIRRFAPRAGEAVTTAFTEGCIICLSGVSLSAHLKGKGQQYAYFLTCR
jgi:hypothetical protein